MLMSGSFGWVLFRSPDIGHAGEMLRAMLVPDGLPLASQVAGALTHHNGFVLTAATAVVLMPRDFATGREVSEGTIAVPGVPRALFVVVALVYASSLAASGTFSPFLYFQF